jgi:hypothetical protein
MSLTLTQRGQKETESLLEAKLCDARPLCLLKVCSGKRQKPQDTRLVILVLGNVYVAIEAKKDVAV